MKTTAVITILFCLSFCSFADDAVCYVVGTRGDLFEMLSNMGMPIDDTTSKFDFTNDGYITSEDLVCLQIGQSPADIVLFWKDCPAKISWGELDSMLVPVDLYYNELNSGRLLISGLKMGEPNHPLWGYCSSDIPLSLVYNIYTPYNILSPANCWGNGFARKPESEKYGQITYYGGKPAERFGYITDRSPSLGYSFFCGFYLINGKAKGYIGQCNYSRSYIAFFPGEFIPTQIYDKAAFDFKKWSIGDVNLMYYAQWADKYEEPNIPIPTIREICENWLMPYNAFDFTRSANIWDGNL
jgi:hypothetical protein